MIPMINQLLLFFLILPASRVFGDPKTAKKSDGDPESIYKRSASQSRDGSMTCPCARPASGAGCIAYDTQYQAASLEEAVINFFDLTALDSSVASNIYGQKVYQPSVGSKPAPFQCGKSPECLACFQALSERLILQWAPTEWGAGGLGLGLGNLTPQSGTSLRVGQQCKRLVQAARNRPSRTTAFSSMSEEEAQALLRELLASGFLPRKNSSAAPGPRREKRDGASGKGTASPLTSAGVTTALDCSFSRGDPVGDNSGYVGLCNLCWTLRTLSPKYFPRYVNELSCHPSDKGCLRGMGKCRERFRGIDVLYNAGTDSNPKWQQYSINSPVSCECQVTAGSTLHGLVDH